jgi:hypothetical protein
VCWYTPYLMDVRVKGWNAGESERPCLREAEALGVDWTQRSIQSEATPGRSELSRVAMTVSAASALGG